MAARRTPQPHALFARHWSTYRQVVEHDWMEHRALTDATAAVLDRWFAKRGTGSPAPELVDLGCGDLALLAPVLRRLPLAGYLGIDLVAEVFPLARAALGPVAYPCRWRQQDLLAWAIAEPGDPPLQLIHASFAIHHLSDAEKAAFLEGCRGRLAPGGLLIWADVFREPAETRPAYLQRYAERIRGGWHALEPGRQEEVVAHLEGFDQPCDRREAAALAAAAGWQLTWAWQGRHRAEALAVLQRG